MEATCLRGSFFFLCNRNGCKKGTFPENRSDVNIWRDFSPRPQGFLYLLSLHLSLLSSPPPPPPAPSLSVILKSIPRETIPMAIRTLLQASLGLNRSDTSLPLLECMSWTLTNSAWGREYRNNN